MDRTTRPLVIFAAFAGSLVVGLVLMLWAMGGLRTVTAPAAIGGPFPLTDPERDTAPAMKDYLSSFDPHLKGLTGDPEAIAKVLSAYRVYAKKVPLKDGDYTMDHTALIYLMDRDGHFVSPFNLKRTPEEAATDLKRYL